MNALQRFGLCSLFISLPVLAYAQSHGGGRSGGTSGGTGGTTGGGGNVGNSSGIPALNGGTTSLTPFISGKVVLDDGTPLSEPVPIETICLGNRHTVAYTDRHGSFTFQFGDPNAAASPDLSDASNSMMTRQMSQQQAVNWKGCQVDAILPGFTSEVVELASRMNTLQDGDMGRVSLHRIAQVEGSSISVTSALAPGDAKKALDKARDAEKKNQWDQAEQSLQKAVKIYPKYATAWFELGRVQMQKNDLTSAKQSFEQSVTADPKFVNPYDGLSQLAFQSKQWPDVIETTNKLLALNPVDFPNAYFLNGVANYYRHNWDGAEKIVRQGIKVDDTHRVPRLQYLLGMILLQKGNYNEATDSLKQYIQLTKQPSEVAEANRELDAIQKLSVKQGTTAEKQ
jgi:tetratricopeptide (TPR) repeat protein